MEEFKEFISKGNKLDAAGDRLAAIECYKKAHRINKKSPIPLSNIAIAYFEVGNISSASKYAKQALKLDSKDTSSLNILGNISFREKDYQKALEYYMKAYEVSPQKTTTLVNLANAYVALKNFSEAEKYAKCAKSNSFACSVLGYIYKELEDYPAAEKTLLNAIELNPQDPWSHNYLSQVYQKNKEYNKALDVGYKAITFSGGNNDHHINFGYMLYEISRSDFDVKKYAEKWLQEYGENDIVQHMANSITKGAKITRANDEYVRSIFDVFASDFEDVLTALNYQVPKKIVSLLQELKLAKKQKILDAGCGTGLCGKLLKSSVDFFSLEGVDISSEMIKIAAQKNVYNKLYVSELLEFLTSKKNKYDLIIAADVFTYFGDFEELFLRLNNALSKEGRVVFSFSENTQNDDIFLHTSGRFHHTFSYVENIINKTGFYIEKNSYDHLRNEGESPVMGYIVSIKKQQ